jgi:hypothetical protein
VVGRPSGKGAVLLAVGPLGSESGFGIDEGLGIRAEALPGTGIVHAVEVPLDSPMEVLPDNPMEVLLDNPMGVLLDNLMGVLPDIPMAVRSDNPMAVLPDIPMAVFLGNQAVVLLDSQMAVVLDSPTVGLPDSQMAVLLAVAHFDKDLLVQVHLDSLVVADLDRTAEAGCLDTVDRGSQVLSSIQTADVAVSSPDSPRLEDALPAIHQSQSVPAHSDSGGGGGDGAT